MTTISPPDFARLMGLTPGAGFREGEWYDEKYDFVLQLNFITAYGATQGYWYAQLCEPGSKRRIDHRWVYDDQCDELLELLVIANHPPALARRRLLKLNALLDV